MASIPFAPRWLCDRANRARVVFFRRPLASTFPPVFVIWLLSKNKTLNDVLDRSAAVRLEMP